MRVRCSFRVLTLVFESIPTLLVWCFHTHHRRTPFVSADRTRLLQWGPISSALKVILESPALRSIEAVVNRLERLHSQTAKTSPALGRLLATPQVSF